MKDCRIRNEMKQQLHRIEPVEADCVIAIRKRARIGGLGLRASAPHFLERKNYDVFRNVLPPWVSRDREASVDPARFILAKQLGRNAARATRRAFMHR